MNDRPPPHEAFRIGAVTRLTGIPADTLRAWERRYNVVEPARAEGRFRLYSRDDVARLALIKRLVDAGHAIGSVANLSMEHLRERLEESGSASRHEEADCGTPKVAVLGEVLPVQLSVLQDLEPGIELALMTRDRQAFQEQLAALDVDVVILEYPALYADTAHEIGDMLRLTNGAKAVVVYGFASRRTVESYTDPRITLMRSPVSLDEIIRICRREARFQVSNDAEQNLGALLSAPIPERRYQDAELAAIAAQPVAIHCECPQHLSSLITSLSNFETFSGDCEDRNAADAALHFRLGAAAARARALMEQALHEVLVAEGLEPKS